MRGKLAVEMPANACSIHGSYTVFKLLLGCVHAVVGVWYGCHVCALTTGSYTWVVDSNMGDH